MSRRTCTRPCVKSARKTYTRSAQEGVEAPTKSYTRTFTNTYRNRTRHRSRARTKVAHNDAHKHAQKAHKKTQKNAQKDAQKTHKKTHIFCVARRSLQRSRDCPDHWVPSAKTDVGKGRKSWDRVGFAPPPHAAESQPAACRRCTPAAAYHPAQSFAPRPFATTAGEPSLGALQILNPTLQRGGFVTFVHGRLSHDVCRASRNHELWVMLAHRGAIPMRRRFI